MLLASFLFSSSSISLSLPSGCQKVPQEKTFEVEVETEAEAEARQGKDERMRLDLTSQLLAESNLSRK